MENTISLSPIELDSFEMIERTVEIRCASGRRSTAEWFGVPLIDVVEWLQVPAETTHLLLTSDDGHRVCIDIRTSFEGLLTLARDGTILDDAKRPVVVAPDLEGIRAVKEASTLVPVSLAPDENPEQLEELQTER